MMSQFSSIRLPELAIAAHGIVLIGLAGLVSYARTSTKTIDGHKVCNI